VAGDGHHAVGHLAELAQVLLCRQDDTVATLGIPRLVDDEDAAGMRAEIRMRLPALEPAAVERLGIPGRVVHEVVQRLPVGPRHDRRQLDQGLIVFARQQQADQVVAEGDTLLRTTEQVVELRTEHVDRFGRGWGGFAWGRHQRTSCRHERCPALAPPPPAAPFVPLLTNQR
jgi:RNase P/RNase MRP subunit p29